MPNMEKVKKGLEVCISVDEGENCPKECPYYRDVCLGCNQVMRDALAMLNEHEAVVRCKDCRWYDEKISFCDNCHLPREQTFFCADGKRKERGEAE